MEKIKASFSILITFTWSMTATRHKIFIISLQSCILFYCFQVEKPLINVKDIQSNNIFVTMTETTLSLLIVHT